MLNKKLYWVYILACNNNSYYTGYTNDLLRRYQEHIQGTRACKYTRSFKPEKLLQSWVFTDKLLAMKAESFIKKLSKKDKTLLIKYPEYLVPRMVAAAVC